MKIGRLDHHKVNLERMNRWLLLLAAVAPLAQAGKIEVCPAHLESTQEIRVPEGWQRFKSGYLSHLDSVRIFDASPAVQTGGLIPDTTEEVADGERATWNLAGNPDAWIVCQYSGVVDGLARPLGAVTRCQVTVKRGGYAPVSVECHQ